MSLIVKSLTKIYGSQKVVNDVSFEAREGQIVGFLGPNGAGKSTTMKVGTGFISPSGGTVEVCGFDVTKNSMDVRKVIGYLPEHNPLYLDMYIKEYLRFIGKLHGLKGSLLTGRVSEMIELCSLQREQHKKIGALSKGFRQRVGLAQALIHDPKVLILDEPSSGLDPNQVEEMKKVIKSASQNKTIIFSTHIMGQVKSLCDKAVIINLGKIVADKAVSELQFLNQTELLLQVEFSAPVDEEALNKLDGVTRIETLEKNKYLIYTSADVDVRNAIFSLSSEKKWSLLGLQQQEQSLESIFQSLTE